MAHILLIFLRTENQIDQSVCLPFFSTSIFLTGGAYTPYSPCMSTPLTQGVHKNIKQAKTAVKNCKIFVLLQHM